MQPEIEVLQNKSRFPKLLSTFILFVVTLVAVGALYYFPKTSFSSTATKMVSPVGGFSKVLLANNIWLPKSEISTSDEVNITAQAAFFIETNSGEVLYAKNAHERMPVASLTKVMTAIIALEHKNFNDTYMVSERAAQYPPDSMYLRAGEELTLEELLAGMFLVSGNDAAETIAEGTTGDREEFIQQMNSTAHQIGMNDTLFINPSGLEEDDPNDPNLTKLQYSTAFDVALMGRYLVKRWPQVTNISSQPQIILSETETHRAYDLVSGINLISTYPGVVGLKIGYTPQAGLTIVTVARRGDKEVVGVLLNCINRRDDTRAMLDYAFSKLQ